MEGRAFLHHSPSSFPHYHIHLHSGAVQSFELESVNVVGYSNKGLQAGYTMTGACFVDVTTGDSVDLTSIKVAGYDDECMDTVSIQTLDAFGGTVATYYWQDDNGGGDFDPGWYDDSYETIEGDSVFFQPGDGLWVAGDDGLNLVFPATTL